MIFDFLNRYSARVGGQRAAGPTAAWFSLPDKPGITDLGCQISSVCRARSNIYLVGLQVLERAVDRPHGTHHVITQDQPQEERNGSVMRLHPPKPHDQRFYQPGDEEAEPE